MTADEVPELVCVGETMALITPAGAPLSSATHATIGTAGAESNVAAQVAGLGHRVAWMSRLGADPLGARVAAEIADRGVELIVEWDEDAPTGVMFKDPGIQASRVLYYRRGSAASRMNAASVRPGLLDGVRIVHTTGITAAISPESAAMVDELFRSARAAGALVSFDVNDRRPLWAIEDAARVLTALATAADIVFVGRDEAERLWGTRTAAEIRAHLPDPALLVVKDGDVGATAFAGDDDPVFVPAPFVDVVEPVGAGDAFAAGFLSATLRELPHAARLHAGHAAAARVLTVMGDLPPKEHPDDP